MRRLSRKKVSFRDMFANSPPTMIGSLAQHLRPFVARVERRESREGRTHRELQGELHVSDGISRTGPSQL